MLVRIILRMIGRRINHNGLEGLLHELDALLRFQFIRRLLSLGQLLAQMFVVAEQVSVLGDLALAFLGLDLALLKLLEVAWCLVQ